MKKVNHKNRSKRKKLAKNREWKKVKNNNDNIVAIPKQFVDTVCCFHFLDFCDNGRIFPDYFQCFFIIIIPARPACSSTRHQIDFKYSFEMTNALKSPSCLLVNFDHTKILIPSILKTYFDFISIFFMFLGDWHLLIRVLIREKRLILFLYKRPNYNKGSIKWGFFTTIVQQTNKKKQ